MPGNTAEAADNYQRSLKLKADNPAVIYSLSNVYQAMGQEDQAKELWGQLIRISRIQKRQRWRKQPEDTKDRIKRHKRRSGSEQNPFTLVSFFDDC